jgi:hypothetical protein
VPVLEWLPGHIFWLSGAALILAARLATTSFLTTFGGNGLLGDTAFIVATFFIPTVRGFAFNLIHGLLPLIDLYFD